MRIRRIAFVAWVLLLGLTDALAHNTSVTYVDLSNKQLAPGLWSLQLMMPIQELDTSFALDGDDNSEISLVELDQKIPAIISYTTDRIGLSATQEQSTKVCALSYVNHHIDQHGGSQEQAAYLSLRLQFDCAVDATSLRFRYDLFGEFDAAHRALLSFASTQHVLVPGVTQSLQVISNSWTSFPGYVRAGFHHILIGWDHLAFLMALLIPLMAVRGGGITKCQVKSLLLIITVFTLGHSMSLAAATLGWLSIPIRMVEVVIAASIVVAAGYCLFRRDFMPGPIFAGGFGLIHGFGFANVLEVGGASGPALWVGLLGFNLGVEAGQLLFVALAMPALAAAARLSVSRPLVTQILPLTLMFAGAGWFAERLINIDLIPG